jgi:pimeloyl-ACP methyl ester carboxylesterase
MTSDLRPWHCAVLLAALAGGGCTLLDIGRVPEQQRLLDHACTIDGSVRGPADASAPRPLVVVLARKVGDDPQARDSWQLADHFVLEQAGRWQFSANPGTYGLVAFEDTDANLRYDPGEPYLRMDMDDLVTCRAGEKIDGLALSIPMDGRPRDGGSIDVSALQVRQAGAQMEATLGELTDVGKVTTLDDPRFTDEVGGVGLWRPFDFLFEYRTGIYLLEPYDPAKVPVLFVHGITGHPANFRTLVGRLDRSRYQPLLYFYPSGGHLDVVADHLTQTMMKLEARYGIRKVVVVAHSMGGLVARGFVLRHQAAAPRVGIPLFITLSTPWDGHKGAAYGVEMSPAVVRVWYDMAPGSAYLGSLYYADAERRQPRKLAPATAHHLMFSFRSSGTVNIGEAGDDTVTVASQLRQEAQRDAVRLYGFDETHMGILDSADALAIVDDLLADQAGK